MKRVILCPLGLHGVVETLPVQIAARFARTHVVPVPADGRLLQYGVGRYLLDEYIAGPVGW